MILGSYAISYHHLSPVELQELVVKPWIQQAFTGLPIAMMIAVRLQPLCNDIDYVTNAYITYSLYNYILYYIC